MGDPRPGDPAADETLTANGAPPEAPLSLEDAVAAEAARCKVELDGLKTKNAELLAQVDELKALAAAPPEAPNDLRRLHLLQIQPVRDILVIFLVLGVFWLGYVLRPITIPMLIALGLAYLVEPPIRYVTSRGWMSRTGAAVSVILLVLVLMFVPLGVGGAFAIAQGVEYGGRFRVQLATLRESLDKPTDTRLATRVKEQGKLWGIVRDFVVKARESSAVKPPVAAPASPTPTGPTGTTLAPTGPPAAPAAGPPAPGAGATGPAVLSADLKAEEPLGKGPLDPAATHRNEPIVSQVIAMLDDLVQRSGASLGDIFGKQVIGTGGDVVRLVGRILLGSFWLLFALFLILFFFFFFSIEWGKVTDALSELIPRWKRDRTLGMIRQMDAVISSFVRGRLIIMVILMGAFTLGYWLIGVPAPLIVGPLVGMLAIIPYAGMISIPVCWLLMWIQPGGFTDWQHSAWWILLAPPALYFVIQFFDDYVITPIIQGKATDMDTPTILFAVLAGGVLLGFYGVLLAVPVAACLKIIIRESFLPRFKAWAEGRVKDFLPISRYDPTETTQSKP